MIELLGRSLVAGGTISEATGETASSFRGYDPAERREFGPTFLSATMADVADAVLHAQAAAAPFAFVPRKDRAAFLEAAAEALLAAEHTVVPLAMQETGLPSARLSGELARTANQLRLFAGVVRDGAYLDIRVDKAMPDRTPPRPDIRMMLQPLGPVVVFGASNFPLAFSVAGGDTASAWAAGCPVIVKAHPAHPSTSEFVGRIIQRVVADCGLPPGIFGLLFDHGHLVGQQLVADPRVRAVGFTGSRSGGVALCAVAARRPEPIPVYAEMSAINPVVLLPGALQARGRAIGAAFAQAQSMGAGQFCTNPGLILTIDSPEEGAFIEAVASTYRDMTPAVMLSPLIHSAYRMAVEHLATNRAVTQVAGLNSVTAEDLTALPVLFATNAAAFMADKTLQEEIFGPASLIVRCASAEELCQVLAILEGQLTVAVHSGPEDTALAAQLMPRVERIAGRVLFDGFGTGVEVCDAMVHGGPWPATSNPATTSVGSLAVRRFQRPVCYQNVPQDLLPADLHDAALVALPHRHNGAMTYPVATYAH